MQFNRNPHEHAAMPDVPVYTQQQLDTATRAAELARPEYSRAEHLRDLYEAMTRFSQQAADLEHQVQNLRLSALRLNSRLREILQESV